MKNILIGITFAILWSSASVATKFGVLSASPLLVANSRFFIAGIILLTFSYIYFRDKSYRLPTKSEFIQLTIFGILNTSVYLGLYVYAMKYTAAGIGSLAVSTNPLIIALLSGWLINRVPSSREWAGIALSMFGIAIATYPLLQNQTTTLLGVLLLSLSMVSVSFASVYYSKITWELPNLLINGWQVLIGGLFLLPFTIAFSDFSNSKFDTTFCLSVLWLSIGVSIFGLICWFYLLKIDTIKASLWLFLCPLFGFFFAWLLMDEPITVFTILGTILVLAGLFLGQKKVAKSATSD